MKLHITYIYICFIIIAAMQCNYASGSTKLVEHLQPMQSNNATGLKSQRVQIIWWCTPIRLQRTSWLQTFLRGGEFFRVTVK